MKWLYHTYFCKVLKCDRAFLAIEEKVYKIRNSVKYINKVLSRGRKIEEIYSIKVYAKYCRY